MTQPRLHRALLLTLWLAALPCAEAHAQARLPMMEGAATPLGQVYNSTRSVVLGDRVDAQRAYVLPPETTWVTPESFQPSANLGQCAEMENLGQVARELSAQIAAPQLLQRNFETALEALRTSRLDVLRQREQSAHFPALRSRADEVEEQSWDVEDEIYAAEQRCSAGGLAGIAQCVLLTGLRAELADLQAQAAALRNEARTLQAQHAQAEQELVRIDTSVADLERSAREQLERLEALFDQTFELYRHYGALLGGTATIRYDSGWDESLVTLATDNPSLRFEPALTRAVQVRAGLIPGIGTDNYLGSLPAVLAYRIGDVPGQDDLMISLPTYPERIEAQLDLSLTGACPLARGERYDIERLGGLPIFGVTTVYEHDVASPFEVTVSYHGLQLLQAIRRPGRRLMLVPSVIEAARPFVTITWNQAPPVVPSERKRAEDQLVSEAVDRVLSLAGLVHHDWNGPDVWRPLLGPAGPSLPRSTVRTVGRLAAMTMTALYDEVLARAPVLPAVPSEQPSPIKRTPTRPRNSELLALAKSGDQRMLTTASAFDTRVTHSAALVYERAVYPVCGYDQLRCDGTGWLLPRDLGVVASRALDRTFSYQRSPHFLTPRLAMSTFNSFGRPTPPPSYVGSFTAATGCVVAVGQSSCEAALTYQTNSARACLYEGTVKLGCHPSALRVRLTAGTHVLVLRSGPSEFAKALATTTLSIAAQNQCVSDAECSDGRWCNGFERCVSGVCRAGTRNCSGGCYEEDRFCCARRPCMLP